MVGDAVEEDGLQRSRHDAWPSLLVAHSVESELFLTLTPCRLKSNGICLFPPVLVVALGAAAVLAGVPFAFDAPLFLMALGEGEVRENGDHSIKVEEGSTEIEFFLRSHAALDLLATYIIYSSIIYSRSETATQVAPIAHSTSTTLPEFATNVCLPMRAPIMARISHRPSMSGSSSVGIIWTVSSQYLRKSWSTRDLYLLNH